MINNSVIQTGYRKTTFQMAFCSNEKIVELMEICLSDGGEGRAIGESPY